MRDDWQSATDQELAEGADSALHGHGALAESMRRLRVSVDQLRKAIQKKNGPRRVVPEAERDWGRYMPEMLFSPDFWKAQWGVIWSAPWVFLPTILIAFAVGWKWKATNDDAETRGLRADRDASMSRLDLVKENALQEAKELADLRHDIFQIKTQLQTGAQPIALATEAERKAIILTSSNNAIREIATIEHRPVRIIQKS